MNTITHNINGNKIIEITSNELLIKTGQDFIELVYQFDTDIIFFKKENFIEEFFDLSTKIAGDILQKASNYKVTMAIIGNFSIYKSKSLEDFIRESNKRKQVIFAKDLQEALKIMF
ncbi:MAG: DUF4180 domain-containing protein [Candidatus Sericytochromatia bacterium]